MNLQHISIKLTTHRIPSPKATLTPPGPGGGAPGAPDETSPPPPPPLNAHTYSWRREVGAGGPPSLWAYARVSPDGQRPRGGFPGGGGGGVSHPDLRRHHEFVVWEAAPDERRLDPKQVRVGRGGPCAGGMRAVEWGRNWLFAEGSLWTLRNKCTFFFINLVVSFGFKSGVKET